MEYVKLAALAVVALLAAIAANFGQDLAYSFHAILIMVIAAGLFLWQLRQVDEEKQVVDTSGYMDGPVRLRRGRHRLLGRGGLSGGRVHRASSWPFRC